LFALKEKDLSAPLYTFSGVGLAELRKIESPRPARFEEVKADVEKDVEESKKKDRALTTIKEVRSKLTDKNWEDLAAKYKLEIKTVDEHKREQYLSVIGENRTVDDLAFSLPLKQVSEPIVFETGYALLRVLDRKVGTKEDFAKEKDAETAAFLDQKKNKFLQAYLARRRTEKGVKVNYEQFLQVSQDILSRYDAEK
jgi:parvulin-like peptidyl-prolyl isomerase